MRDRTSRRTIAAFVAALVVVLLSGAAWAGFTPPPRPDTAVADTADVLTLQQEEALRGRLRALKDRTGVSFVVATVSTLDGADIKQASIETFKAWGVGGEENRGLLFTVYVDEARKAGPGAKRCGCIRLEVGRYLEGDVTDTATKRVLKKAGPVVVMGDFDRALNLAVDGVEDILKDASVSAGTEEGPYPESGGGVVLLAFLLAGACFVGVVILFLGYDTPGAQPIYRRSTRHRRHSSAGSCTTSSRSDSDDGYGFPSASAGLFGGSDDGGSRWSSGGSSYDGGSDDSDFFGGGDAGGGGSDW